MKMLMTRITIGDQEMAIERLSSYDPEHTAKSKEQVRSGKGTEAPG